MASDKQTAAGDQGNGLSFSCKQGRGALRLIGDIHCPLAPAEDSEP
jgi:hypothetical protein